MNMNGLEPKWLRLVPEGWVFENVFFHWTSCKYSANTSVFASPTTTSPAAFCNLIGRIHEKAGKLEAAPFCDLIRKKWVMLVKIEKWIYIIFCWHKTSGTDITEFGWRNISFLLDKRKMSKVNFFDILKSEKNMTRQE